jgi:hypothetical protein
MVQKLQEKYFNKTNMILPFTFLVPNDTEKNLIFNGTKSYTVKSKIDGNSILVNEGSTFSYCMDPFN